MGSNGSHEGMENENSLEKLKSTRPMDGHQASGGWRCRLDEISKVLTTICRIADRRPSLGFIHRSQKGGKLPQKCRSCISISHNDAESADISANGIDQKCSSGTSSTSEDSDSSESPSSTAAGSPDGAAGCTAGRFTLKWQRLSWWNLQETLRQNRHA